MIFRRTYLSALGMFLAGTAGMAAEPQAAPTVEIRTVTPAEEPPLPASATEVAAPGLEPIAQGPQVYIDGAKGALGRLDIVPIVQVRSTYDSNIFITRTHPKADLYTSVVAGLALGWGDFRDQLTPLGAFQQQYEGILDPDFDSRQFLYASYTPGYTFFANHTGENTFDQNAALGARGSFGNLTLDAKGYYRHFSEGVVEVGTRIRQTQLDAAINSRYQISGQSSAEADLSVITSRFDQRQEVNSTEWSDRNYLNWQIEPKTSLSAGAAFGYISVDKGAAQTYEQVLARVSYDSGRHVSGNLYGGVEFRQFGVQDDVNPVFGLQAFYSPWDATMISLSASRVVTVSAAYAGQDVVITGATLKISQELYGRITLGLWGGFQNYDYGQAGGLLRRNDDVLRMEVFAAFHVTPRVSVSLAYDYWHNTSSINTFTFDDNRASLYLDLLF